MTIIKRRNKVSNLTPDEVDGNFDYIETELNNSPRLVKNVSNEVIGITDGNQTFTISEKPIENLKNSAVAVSSTLTEIDEVLYSFTIKAGVLGVNSILQIEPMWTYTNSVNNKILKVKIANTTVFSVTRTTSVVDSPIIIIANRNSLTSQIKPLDGNYISSGSTSPAIYTINFSNDVLVEIIGQRANSSDILKLEYFRVIHFVGD